MDTKNVIAAISLSAAVLILYSLFFVPEPDPSRIKKDPIEKTKTKSKDITSQITAQQAQDIINILLKGVE